MSVFRSIAFACVSAGLLGVAAGVIGYVAIKPSIERDALAEIRADSAERAARQRQLFSDVSQLHGAAERVLLRRFAALANTDVTEAFDALFPLYGDGTRRSAPALFDGAGGGDGDSVHGIGAFIADAENLTQNDMRLLIAAYHTVRQHGAAAHGRFDNFYFHTTENRLVIFGPDRDDNLEFYRRTAPADFDFQLESTARVVSPESNPMGMVACTDLTRLIYRRDGQALTTGCHLPVRQRGQHLGAFGVTIPMQNYLANAVLDHRDGAQNIIVTRDGGLIAHTDLLMLEELSPQAVADAQQSVGAGPLAAAIRRDGRSIGAFIDAEGRYVTFSRLDAPGWYFVTLSPMVNVTGQAVRYAFLLAVFVMFGAMAQMLIVAAARPDTRKAFTAWLDGLARTTEPLTP